MKNILVVSSRQWNCGDEFIFYGIRALLESIGVKGNYILYNRHPSINRAYSGRFYRCKEYISSFCPAPHLDNSFRPDIYGADEIKFDCAIVAGSPEWHGRRLQPFFKFVTKNNIPTFFLGIGTASPNKKILSKEIRAVLDKVARLVVVRDRIDWQAFEGVFPLSYAPCPALFSADIKLQRKRNKLARVGLVLQASKGPQHQTIPATIFDSLIKNYRKIEEKYKVVYIAHHINDLILAHKIGLGDRVKYSSYSEDYFLFYDSVDFVVSPRVHGCGLAASLGIPSLSVSHDVRSATVEGFQSVSCEASEDLSAYLSDINIEKRSEELIKHRARSFESYRSLLLSKMSDL